MSFIFGGPSPEEMREAAERQSMKIEDFRRGVTRLFNELNEDQLSTLTMLFHMLSATPNENMPQVVSYYEGMLTCKLQDRFNICPNCGENHEEIKPEDFEDEDKDSPEPKDDLDDAGPLPHPDAIRPSVEVVPELHPDDLAKMEEYNLDDVRDMDTLKLLHFVCKGCGLKYQSIEDRMRRDPGVEGCDGCQQKAKFG